MTPYFLGISLSSRRLSIWAGVLVLVSMINGLWGMRKIPAPRAREVGLVLATLWTLLVGAAMGFWAFLSAPWVPAVTLRADSSVVRSYVGCDGATTDPCVIVRQEWSLLPGLIAFRPLYNRTGREHRVEWEDASKVRIRVEAFPRAEAGPLPAESAVVRIEKSPWS
jgi:hypothetical protein